MTLTTPSDARNAVLETVGHLQALAIMGVTKQQQETALKLATRLLAVLPLLDTAGSAAPAPNTGEPAMPSVDAPTSVWFVYYREMIAFQSRELTRLRRIENAAMRVASSRRCKVVTDQAPLDALDAALGAQS